MLHQPILQKNGWNGVQWVSTTTPTSTFFPPAPGWSKTMLRNPPSPDPRRHAPLYHLDPFSNLVADSKLDFIPGRGNRPTGGDAI